MVKLLIIADDFTGALDTGVQFASYGTLTRVITDNNFEMNSVSEDIQVLVIDAETRHLNENDAYEIIYKITTKAKKYGVQYIYKKTDSALRGNIGKELTAVLEASGDKTLRFIPAFPEMMRTTRKGIQYINGIPVHESVFGKDPFEPVVDSYIPDIIAKQSSVAVEIIESGRCSKEYSEPSIVVYDAESEKRLREIAKELKKENNLRVTAGCAGFAKVLSEVLELGGMDFIEHNYQNGFLVVCGSINPITQRQLNYGEEHGFKRIRLNTKQKLDNNFFITDEGEEVIEEWFQTCKNNKACIIDTNDMKGINETIEYGRKNNMNIEQIRYAVSDNLGLVVKKLFDKGIKNTILFTGGDTLLGFMKQMGIHEMKPICELVHGTVLSEIVINGEKQQVISKSGGFGTEDLLVKLSNKILHGRRKMNVN